MNPQIMSMLPNLQPEEFVMLQKITDQMNDAQQQQFFSFYSSKRKEQQGLLILAIIGFFGFAGIHRLVIGQTAMGILYLLTLGFCFIGTIVDIVNIRTLAWEYNQRQALEAATMVSMIR